MQLNKSEHDHMTAHTLCMHLIHGMPCTLVPWCMRCSNSSSLLLDTLQNAVVILMLVYLDQLQQEDVNVVHVVNAMHLWLCDGVAQKDCPKEREYNA